MKKQKEFKIQKKTNKKLLAIGAISLMCTVVLASVYAGDAAKIVNALSPFNNDTAKVAVSKRTSDHTSHKATSSQTPTNKTVNPAPSTPSVAAKTQPPAQVQQASLSIRGKALFIDPQQQTAGKNAAIVSNPLSTWLGGWTANPEATVRDISSRATAANASAVFVLYNIPHRDCGGYSAGGVDASSYRAWIQSIANGIQGRNAIIILEPDALAQIDCLSQSLQNERYSLLSNAVTTLSALPQTYVYIDGGHSAWIDSATMASRLAQANISVASGFSLNVSNFQTTASSTTYGNKIAAAVGKNFVIDTSRNGAGPNSDWCNPKGRKLGQKPTTNVSGYIDAYLWIKTPGESDGECNGGPSAGVWWSQYADDLAS